MLTHYDASPLLQIPCVGGDLTEYQSHLGRKVNCSMTWDNDFIV